MDRLALELGPDDSVLVITSAGCNTLDYALTGPRVVYAVDANPRQTALLELKLAGIRRLQHDDFFALFGRGRHPKARELYYDTLRTELDGFSRDYWDRHYPWFSKGQGNSFYFHGLSGLVARSFRTYLRMRPRLSRSVHALFQTCSLEEQRQVYDEQVEPLMWSRGMNWTLSRQLTMSLLGVPYPQRREVQAQHEGGVAGFIREAIQYVFRQLPVSTNYFWAVYLFGAYSKDCCPEYLKPDNFERLKAGLVDRIEPHTCTVTEFLEAGSEPISRFVLLDHMDWMSSYYPEALEEEWAHIVRRASADARVIFRSAHARPRYLDRLTIGPERQPLTAHFRFHPELAAELTLKDRVHTYAGFHIATAT